MIIKYCHNSDIFYHRDIMAPENIANILRSMLQRRNEPEYSQRYDLIQELRKDTNDTSMLIHNFFTNFNG